VFKRDKIHKLTKLTGKVVRQSQSASVYLLLTRLWPHISSRRRSQFAAVLILTLVSSFTEVVSIGAVLPFIGAITDPERTFMLPAIQPLIHFFGLSNATQLLLPLTVTFGTAAIVAGLTKLLLLWANTRLSFALGADLSISVYRRTLYQSYSVHCLRNTSEVINSMTNKITHVIHVINMCLTMISAIIILVAILLALLLVDPIVTMLAIGGFGAMYILVIRISYAKVALNSERVARESTNVIKTLQEGLGGIRDVLLDGSQNTYCDIFRKSDLSLRAAQSSNAFIGNSPRYGMEALGLAFISLLAYFTIIHTDRSSDAIPLLGALALGAQRLLPVLQQAYSAWTGIHAGRASLEDTLDLLEQPLPCDDILSPIEPIQFVRNIILNHINFRYFSDDAPYVLRDINLTIPKGSRVGFIGTTGCGKSTLLDIVMGLLLPSGGALIIDDVAITPKNLRAWQNRIAHVPQSIFLADTTIEENIAFGVPKEEIQHEQVRRAAHQARIAAVIETLPGQYQAMVGERGMRLSGGQRQRIGIARALYKQADVIILDEATSALDHETEEAVMNSLALLNKDLTFLIVAHRLTTLEHCDVVVELVRGKIGRVGSYHEIVGNSR
jgi:ABC-type bacteriocin/lantibiotic exporter with double-glycine peptidase domain